MRSQSVVKLDEPASWSDRLTPARSLPVPGPVHGDYPIREQETPPQRMAWAWLKQSWRSPGAPSAREDRRLLAELDAAMPVWQRKSQPDFERDLITLRAQLSIHGFQRERVAQAMAAVGVIVKRQLGWQVHEVQWLGAWWMLEGRLIEMATGEGKSLVVVLAATVAALAHVPVHVMTANDYLARRDAQQWQPIYEALGLSLAWLTASSTHDQRRKAYQQDLVYVTAKEVAFDHLRDLAAKAAGLVGNMVLRGLCMAVIDEADSILIDEACTPLVLSQALPGRQAEQQQRLALYLARQLKQPRDFTARQGQAVCLLAPGASRLTQAAKTLPGPWRLQRFREDQVVLALTALHALARDVDYLVRDGEVHIIDACTGRLALGRAWSRGLHQMVCIKEGLGATPETETLTQTTYQTFFPRYHRVCGLSGTLWEERAELMAIHGLPVVRMPLRQPGRRQDLGMQMCASAAEQWQRVAQVVRQVSDAGRAVLVGTDSVADSEALSQVLQAQGIVHQLLNARHDSEQGDAERELIAQAGKPGAVTVATHMAGRGTDILLDPRVLRAGGLHVINTHLNASARIDRQLHGRAARQGQPGSFERILRSSDTSLSTLPDWARIGLDQARLVGPLCRWAQWLAGRQTCAQRWGLLQSQFAMRRQLLWAGRDDWL